MYEQVAVGLINGGWPPEGVVPGIVAIESFHLRLGAGCVCAGEHLRLRQPCRGVPDLHCRGCQQQTPGPDESRADIAFEGGLTAMISGLRDQIGVRE